MLNNLVFILGTILLVVGCFNNRNDWNVCEEIVGAFLMGVAYIF